MVILILLLPLYIIAGEFTAQVTQNLGEGITLNLTLKETTAKGNPSFNVLNDLFFVQSQAQSAHTTIINGTYTLSTTWTLTLIPKVKGEMEIPPITVSTAEGLLSTAPVKVHAADTPKKTNDFQLLDQVSNEKPYKNQPFFYTLELSSKYDVHNVQVEKLEIENAIVEASQQSGNLKYLITPLKPGALKIPPLRIQGEMIENSRHDPFARLFGRLKPFALSTEEKVIEVQPPVAKPWLPANSLKIEEIWDANQPSQVDEPLLWGFKIKAEGIKSNQLPELNPSSEAFKIYADKPQTGDEIKGDTLHSYRQEHFTLIPTNEGTFTLPEISIQWWNVDKKKLETATLPPRILHIVPALDRPKPEEPAPAPQIVVMQNDSTWPYIVIGVLALLFLGALGWLILLQRKVIRLKREEANKPSKKKLPDLNPT